MSNNSVINSDSYWDGRFATDWESNQGPLQSRFFARLAMENLPSWLIKQVRRESLTIADWGCAQGDGTDVLGSHVDPRQVTGIDFSEVAIAQAASRYPALRFVAEDWLKPAEQAAKCFDIVFSSNTLEHFHHPWEVLQALGARATKAVALALPYRELERIDEHFYSFLPGNVPMALPKGFRLVWSRVVDCRHIPGTLWAGDQIFLVYAAQDWIDELQLTLGDFEIGHDGAAAQIADLQRQLAALDGKITTAAQRDVQVDQLRQAIAEQDTRLDWLNQAVVERDRQAAAAAAAAAADAAAAEHAARMAAINQTVAERDQQIAELRQKDLAREAQLTSLNARLFQLSNWAQGIERNPLRYAAKKAALDVARSTLRALPLSMATKQRLRDRFFSAIRPMRKPAQEQPVRERSISAAVLQQADKTFVESDRDIFVFAVIDWSFRSQRPQHIARSLADAGRRVFYFSNHFVDADQPGYQLEQLPGAQALYQIKLHVKGAPAIYFDAPSDEALAMLKLSMAQVIEDFGALSSLSIVQHAYWYPLVTLLPNTYRIYDCMDHHEGFGNVPEKLMEIEKDMLAHADLVTVTSSWLEDFARAYNPNVALVRNASEYAHFAQRPAQIYADRKGRQVIGYYGAIAEWFDLDLLRAVAQAYPDCLVLLVGNDTVEAQKRLADLPNVEFTGEVPYDRLPYYLHAFDVCLLPFQVIPLTLATNPVKVYEYLAAGKPVVCVDLPEISQFDGLVGCAATSADFIALTGAALRESGADAAHQAAARRAFAVEQTWHHRVEELLQGVKAIKMPRVSVIILTFNNLDLTKACLDSVLKRSDYPNLEVIVVDNASTDGTPAYLEDFGQRHPEVRMLLNSENLGFAAGNNVGLAIATGDYLVVLNNDTVVTPGWVLTLLRHFQRVPALGLLGPVTSNIGNEARIEISYPDLAHMPATALNYTLGHMGERYPMTNVAFFCTIFPRSTYERCGEISEDYGLGFFEDDDYCRKVDAAGLAIACAEDVFVHHHLSASFNKMNDEKRRALVERNKAIYESKWGPWVPHRYRP